jgi:hypothetical protein
MFGFLVNFYTDYIIHYTCVTDLNVFLKGKIIVLNTSNDVLMKYQKYK